MFDADDTFEDFLSVGIPGRGWNDARTVDEVDTAHERDVLPHLVDLASDVPIPKKKGERPYLCFAWNGRNSANFLFLECVYDAALTHVGVADEPDANLLLVREEGRELSEEGDEGALAKRVVDRGVEGNGRMGGRQMLDPPSLSKSKNIREAPMSSKAERGAHRYPARDKITLVENVDELLMALFLYIVPNVKRKTTDMET
jgi:hypothetical protein